MWTTSSHTDNNDDNSTAGLPHEASMMSIKKSQWKMPWRRAHPSQIEIVWESKAHKLATVEHTKVAGKNGEWQLENVKAERARFSRGSILHEVTPDTVPA